VHSKLDHYGLPKYSDIESSAGVVSPQIGTEP
jgi:hypothetical protein